MLVGSTLCLLPLARAGDDADAWIRTARAAERAGDPAAERAACEALVRTFPDDRSTPACAQRLAWIAARADTDGGLVGLEGVLNLQREAHALSPEQVEARARALLGTPGLSEVLAAELWLRVARSAASRGDPEEALRAAAQGLALPGIPEPVTRQLRGVEAAALAASGRAEEALAVEQQAGLLRSARPQEGAALVLRERRRSALGWASWAAVAVFGAISTPLAARGWSRAPRPRPMGLVPLTLAILGAAVLAGARDANAGLAALALWPPLAALHLLSAGAAIGRVHCAVRLLIGIMAGLASAGACFLVLQRFGLLGTVGL